MAGIFKAYDVRGIYPEQLNEDTAQRIGWAFSALLPEGPDPVVIGRDMRPHSEPLASALIEGLNQAGRNVVDIGLATTPMNYFSVGHLAASGGIQVTASHNPAEYNGFKFSLREARPVSGDDGIPEIERRVHEAVAPASARQGEDRLAVAFAAVGGAYEIADVAAIDE